MRMPFRIMRSQVIRVQKMLLLSGRGTQILRLCRTFLVEKYPDLKDRLVFVNCGGSSYYQDKIDALLDDPSNELYPDMMLLEVGYVQKYVQSDYLMSL